MADALSLLFELDADGRPAVAEFQRIRKAFAGEIAALRKTVAQSFTLPPIKLPTAPSAGRSGKQADDHVKEFRRIEAEAAKSTKAQEREQQRLSAAVESLQRQRTAALVRAFKEEERAATASAKAQERAIAASFKAQEKAASAAAKAQEQAARQAAARLARTPQSDQQVRDFRRIEAERQKSAKAAETAAAKSARVQEAEQRRLNRSVEALQRQRSTAIIAGFKAEERAAIATARAQERAAQQASRSIASAFRGIGPGLQSIGRTLTIGITAPLLALGAASLKSAKDIDANVNTLKAFTGSTEAAEARLAQLIKTARATPGLTTNLALTLDAQLRVAKTTQETIDRVLPAIGRLNAVSKLPDAARFTNNLLQLVTQNFERQDLKELVGQSPLAGQLITEIFKVDSPTNGKAIRAAAKKLGLTTVEAFFAAFADAASKNQGLRDVTESIGTRFDKIVDRVTVALRPLGLSILKAIEPFIEPVVKLIQRISNAFDSLSEPVKRAIIVIAGIAAVVGPVSFVLGSLATGITAVVSAIGTISAVVAALGLPVIAAAVAGIVVLIGEWVVILGALGLAWKTNFLNIRGLAADAAGEILEAFTRIKSVIDEATQRILPTLQSITTKVLGFITAVWERYGTTVIRVLSTSFEFATRILEAFLRFFGNLIDLVLKLIDRDWRGAWRAFSRIVINALDGLVDLLDNLLPLVDRAFRVINAFLIRQAVALAQTAGRLAERFILAMAAGLIAGAPLISDALAKMLLVAAVGVAVGPIGAILVARLIEEMRKAASEGVTVPVSVEEQGLARIRLNPDGSPKRDRPKPAPVSDEAKKGADSETRRRIRLLELEAERADAIAQQRIAAENIRFEQRKTSLKEFTDFQIAEEQIVFDKKKAVFAAERAEAEKLGKGRDLALGEIRLKELKAEIDFANKRNQLLANQEREELEAAKAHRQALVDIQDEGDKKQLELIDSYVERYLISFEEAEKRRLKIEFDARDRRRAELETQLGEAGQNVQEQQRIKDAIAKLDTESATAREEAENRKRRAIKATLEAEQNYYDTLRQIALKSAQLIRDAASIELGRLVSKFGDRRRFRLETLRLEREANEEEHRERLRQIEQDKKDAEKRLEGVRDAEEKLLKLRRKFAELEKAENERRKEEKKKEDDDERDVRDPFKSLRERFENFKFDIKHTNDSIADSIQSLSEQINSSISSMVDALAQGYQAWLLYGDSMGKALKAALAQQLAAISAECLVQALKHAAYAIGSLAFGNFAAAAKHAAAAAAFGAAAAATGFGARALARSAGIFKPNSTTAAAGVNGGSEPSPRNATFNFGGQGPVETSSQAARDGSGGLLSRREANDRALVDALNNHTAATLQLNTTISRLKTQPKGVVVADGLEENPAAAGTAVLVHSNSSGDFNEALQRNLGFAR